MAELPTPPVSYRDSTDMFFAGRPTSTAYGGASADIADANQYSVSGLEDHRKRSFATKPTANIVTSNIVPLRQGLGSRLMNASSQLTRSGTVLGSKLKETISYAAQHRAQLSSTSTDSNNTTTFRPDRPPTASSSKFLGGLFDGDSAPVRLGVPSPSKEDDEVEFIMDHRTTFTPRPNTRHQRSISAISAKSSSSPKSWFSRKETPPAAASSPQAPKRDEFATMNISSALFPSGPADPLDPQSFNDLLLTATALLTSFQEAYRGKCEALAALQPELEVQKEEVEEANTRSEHLKLQLEGIGRVCEEQKKVNEELVGVLAKTREEVAQGRETIRLVRRSTAGSSIRGKRRSEGGSSVADSGYSGGDAGEEEEEEDDDDDYASSIAGSSSNGSEGLRTPEDMRVPMLMVSPEYDGREWGSGGGKVEMMRKEVEASGGVWGTVQTLRHENVGLKLRVESLQQELQGCIEFVEGVGMI
ncbi:unnamed protein product [Zymoseptoria tritici ST99CH_1A5]|uniref:Uncharacterized protein n=2 Tax=Zymoseptoria tritici TaxID=1047171 RepID=A0A2H1GUR1_ZYMTR|nr:unnamed protein product [Zymoseptoria tritici ST99CH_1E4]SMR60185.1 unnamed protein product [Zymoseptoria tritici ST99CH_3D1]SMY27378.1 unnamed protein product [Zymoseptoria tritici ST99CH_1A5]